MKQWLLLGAFLFANLLLAQVGIAFPAAPADTLKGQAHFTYVVSEALCDKLTQSSQQLDFNQLSTAEIQDVFEKTAFSVLSDHLSELQAMLAQVPAGQANALGAQIGREAMTRAITTCPAAGPLVARLADQTASLKSDLTEEEQRVLLPIAQRACQQISTSDAATPLRKMPASQRLKLLQQLVVDAILDSEATLEKQYGAEALDNEEQFKLIGKKIGSLMLHACPSYMVMLGADSFAEKAAAVHSQPVTPATIDKRKRPVKKPASVKNKQPARPRATR